MEDYLNKRRIFFAAAIDIYAFIFGIYPIYKFPIVIYLCAISCVAYYLYEYFKKTFQFKWYELGIILMLVLNSIAKVSNIVTPLAYNIFVMINIFLVVLLCIIQTTIYNKDKHSRNIILRRYFEWYFFLLFTLIIRI